MLKWQEIALNATLGAAVPIVGGLVWLGRLESRVDSLEKQKLIQQKDAQAPDPVRAKCAELADALAKLPHFSPEERATPIGQAGYDIKSAMDALAYFRVN